MNPLNYASLSASRRLVEAGIVLETEASWYERETFFELDLTENYDYHNGKKIPAPCMAEVWRELPERINDRYLHFTKMNDKAYTYYGAIWNPLKSTENDNPTDALIDLLIWVRNNK